MRIVTPPRSMLPMYRTYSNPELPTERTRILQRARAARVQEYLDHPTSSVYKPPMWANILTIVTVVLSVAGLTAMACFAPGPPKN